MIIFKNNKQLTLAGNCLFDIIGKDGGGSLNIGGVT